MRNSCLDMNKNSWKSISNSVERVMTMSSDFSPQCRLYDIDGDFLLR